MLGIHWNQELEGNEWLVKWKGLLDNEATWESIFQMSQQFPNFHLEDKVNLEPRGRTYKRRGKMVKVQKGMIRE